MKYTISAKVYNMAFGKMFKQYLKDHPMDIDIKDVLKKTKKEYKAMLERTPGLNGNFMESNLVGACWYFALVKSCPGMTPKLLDEINEVCLNSPMMVNMHAKCRKKGLLFTDKEMEKWEKASKISQSSNLEMDWVFTFKHGKDNFDIDYTKCGCCRLAERENMMEYLPCLCHLDFSKFKVKGAKLTRSCTLEKGDSHCDFHLDRIQE